MSQQVLELSYPSIDFAENFRLPKRTTREVVTRLNRIAKELDEKDLHIRIELLTLAGDRFYLSYVLPLDRFQDSSYSEIDTIIYQHSNLMEEK